MEANKIPQMISPSAASPGPEAAQNVVLARLVKLAQAALKAETAEKAGAVIVNQVHTLVRTDRAVVVPLGVKRRIFCISGDLEPSDDNLFSQAVHEVRRTFGRETEPCVIAEGQLPEGMAGSSLQKVLSAMGGTSILWFPLPAPDGSGKRYALWLERWKGRPWTPEEIRILTHADVFLGHALSRNRGIRKKARSGWRTFCLLMLVLGILMLLPVHSRVTAPVQVVPDRPSYIFAPFDGIMEKLHVQPGQKVRDGEVLYRYDTRILDQQLEEARRAVAVARAELARLEGAAYADEEARARIPVQKLEVERKQAEMVFIQQRLELSEVKADTAGVVVLDDPDALIGASLRTGQLVMRIADPARTKLRIMMPVADAGLVQPDAPARIRLDSDPLKAFDCRVERVGYDVQISDQRVPSVLVEAEWTDAVRVTPGQRGTAQIQGPQVMLGAQVFRKPLMKIRQVFGI